MISPEAKHIIVCKQLRYQLRKRMKLLQAHAKGLHQIPVLKCPRCEIKEATCKID